MNLFRNTYRKFSQLACLLLALHFFNMSIDSVDSQPDNKPEDLSINDIETFSEFIAEVVLGHTNAFVEHDEHDGDKKSSDASKIFFFHQEQAGAIPVAYPSDGSAFLIRNTDSVDFLLREISSPPPKG